MEKEEEASCFFNIDDGTNDYGEERKSKLMQICWLCNLVDVIIWVKSEFRNKCFNYSIYPYVVAMYKYFEGGRKEDGIKNHV